MGLVITGMHRSGTSAVARLVSSLGLSHGELDMGPAPDNPLGFFERRDVMKLNDRWLKELGGCWWAPPLTVSNTWSRLDQVQLKVDRESLDIFDPGVNDWFIKDPRLSLLMPLWDRFALRTLPMILVVRDPRDTVNSIHLRDGLTPRRALALWYAYLSQALDATYGRATLVIDYDALVEAPEYAVESVADFASQCSSDASRISKLEDLIRLIEPNLRRNRHSRVRGVSTAELDEALDLHALVTKAHAESDVELPNAIDLPDWVLVVLDDLREAYQLETRAQEAIAVAHTAQGELDAVCAPGGELYELREGAASSEARLISSGSRIDSLTKEVEILRNDAVSERDAFTVVSTELTRLRSLLDQTEDARSGIEVELVRTQTLLERVKKDFAGATDRAAVTELDSVAARQVLDTRLSELHEQLSALSHRSLVLDQQLAERTQERGQLTNRVGALEELLNHRDHDLLVAKVLEREVGDLRVARDDADSARVLVGAKLEQARSQLSDMAQSRTETETEVKLLRAESLRLTQELATGQSARVVVESELDRVCAQLAIAERSIVELEKEQRSQNSHLSSAESLVSSLSQRQESLKDTALILHGQVTSGELRHQELQEQLDSLTSALDNQNMETAVLRESLIKLERLAENARAASESEIEAITRRADSFDAQFKLSTQELADLAAERNRLVVELFSAGKQADRQSEAVRLLTEILERTRGLANRAHQESEKLDVERTRRIRLSKALLVTMAEGQAAVSELEAIRGSRSFRFGRRLTAPGRMFRHSQPLDDAS